MCTLNNIYVNVRFSGRSLHNFGPFTAELVDLILLLLPFTSCSHMPFQLLRDVPQLSGQGFVWLPLQYLPFFCPSAVTDLQVS